MGDDDGEATSEPESKSVVEQSGVQGAGFEEVAHAFLSPHREHFPFCFKVQPSHMLHCHHPLCQLPSDWLLALQEAMNLEAQLSMRQSG